MISQHRSQEYQSNIQKIISNFSRQVKNVFFLQIGSGDGVTGDPLHTFIVQNQWSGILVEPVNSNSNSEIQKNSKLFMPHRIRKKQSVKCSCHPLEIDLISSFYAPFAARFQLPNRQIRHQVTA